MQHFSHVHPECVHIFPHDRHTPHNQEYDVSLIESYLRLHFLDTLLPFSGHHFATKHRVKHRSVATHLFLHLQFDSTMIEEYKLFFVFLKHHLSIQPQLIHLIFPVSGILFPPFLGLGQDQSS